MRTLCMLIFVLLMACGEEPIVERTLPPGFERQAGPAEIVPEPTGTVWDVEMVGSPAEGFRFEPAVVNIKVGDTVRWINSSGFPHNVAFYADSIPAGAASVFETVMPVELRLGPLIGPLVNDLGSSFEITFLNAPVGSYRYYSMVQEAVGMAGTVTVER